MSTHTTHEANHQDDRRLMNSALLRMASVAVMSILFALIQCVAPVDGGLPIAPTGERHAGAGQDHRALAAPLEPRGAEATSAVPNAASSRSNRGRPNFYELMARNSMRRVVGQ